MMMSSLLCWGSLHGFGGCASRLLAAHLPVHYTEYIQIVIQW